MLDQKYILYRRLRLTEPKHGFYIDRRIKLLNACNNLFFCLPIPPLAGNSVEVDESLFQEIEDLELDEDEPDFDPLDMGSDED